MPSCINSSPFVSCFQGLTLVHFLAERKHFLWDILGTYSRIMGHNSSEIGHKTTP